MGLFDILKRKKPTPPEQDGPSVHYVFAHIALRHIALAEPLQFLAMAASPNANNFLASVMQDVEEQLGRKASFNSSALTVHRIHINNFPCVIIELPDPSKVAEAYMVAFVVLVDTTQEEMLESSTVTGRYFTLEKCFTLDNESRPVLAEWDEERHSNYGDGPAPTVEALRQAIAEILSQPAG